MLLSNSISGMVFSGCERVVFYCLFSCTELTGTGMRESADVGGFFGNPPPEMMTRWYQIGAFSPFFRAHGHIDTKRREPYLFDQPYQGIMREAIRTRTSLMPAFYTAFYQASQTGAPIMRCVDAYAILAHRTVCSHQQGGEQAAVRRLPERPEGVRSRRSVLPWRDGPPRQACRCGRRDRAGALHLR